MWYEYDFAAAEREFERSIELNPRYATAHSWFGVGLSLMGRYEEAYTEATRAIRLDPHSGAIHFGLGWVYVFGRRYDQAIEQFEKALELEPNSAQAHNGLGLAYLCKSMHEPAIAAFRKAERLSQGGLVAYLGDGLAAAGYPDEAQQILEHLKKRQRYVSPYLAGRIYLALGKKDEAIRCLEAAYRQRDAWLVLVKTDPRLDNLRSHPRFEDLLRRMNFPP
jgi:tetratricopeptide (TPR) repeat protein